MNKVLVGVAMLAVAPGLVVASGGGSTPMPSRGGSEAAKMTPEQQAAVSYNDGLKHVEKADAARKEAAAAKDDAKKHDKAVAQSKKEYEKALSEFEDAVQKNPKLHQAFNGVGYAKRKLGDYDGALAAYGQALTLVPNYAPAIEYRAEAYLGLNRVEEAKSAYTTLFTGDRKRADELHTAMKEWLEMRRKDPAGVATETIEEFSTWLSQREQVAATTSQLLPQKSDRW